MNNKKLIFFTILSIVITIVATISVTYAFFATSASQSNPNTLTTTCYDITFTDTTPINISSYPMSSVSAFNKLTPYGFTITNNCDVNTEYQIILNIKNTTSDKIIEHINYSFDKTTVNKLKDLNQVSLPLGVASNDTKASYVINSGSLSGVGTNKNFSLIMWIDEDASNDIMGSRFEVEVMVYSVAK